MRGTVAARWDTPRSRFSVHLGRGTLGAPIATIRLGAFPRPFFSGVAASTAFRMALAAVAAAGFSIAGLSGVARAGDLEVSGAVTVAGPTAPGVAAGAAPAPA